jgi:hypothetical protein
MFNDQRAFEHVNTTWKLPDGHKWVLVTHTSGCSTSIEGQNTFWLVSDVTVKNNLTINLAGKEIALSHCVDDVTVVWGTHIPLTPGQGGFGELLPSGKPSASGGSTPTSSSSSGDKPPVSNAAKPSPTPDIPVIFPPVTNPNPSSSARGSSGVSSAKGSGPSAVTPPTSSVPNSNSLDCGPSPGPTYLGFPTAPCGDGFDTALDTVIGFYGFDSSFSADLQQFAPGLDSYEADAYQSDPTSLQRAIRKRGFCSKVAKFCKKVAKTVERNVLPVVSEVTAVVKKIQAVGKKVGDFVKAVVNALDNLGANYGAKTFNITLGPPKDSDCPWGRQSSIFKLKTHP